MRTVLVCSLFAKICLNEYQQQSYFSPFSRRKEAFTSRQLLLGLILRFAGRNVSRCSELFQSIYTRVVPLICHVIMVQPAYLLPPNAENDVSSIATRLANFGNMLTEWEHAVDAIIQNCGHHRLDSCLKRCMQCVPVFSF